MTETLPAHWYVDEGIARRERETIFAKNWLLFGPEAGLAETGSWRAEEVNGWPIVVVRGADGALRAFHNVCRHRGAKLFAEGEGRCSAIVCPYHAWTYQLDGALAGAPGFGDGIERGALGLYSLHVDVWQGLVFVAIDPDVPSLLDWLGSAPAICRDFPLAPDMDYFGSFTVEGDANWKTYCDNTVEGYHLATVHPRLARAVVAKDISITGHDGGRLVVFDVRYANDGGTLRGDRGIWFYRFPSFQTVVGMKGFKAERIEPLGARRQRSTSWAWYRDLSPEARADNFRWAEAIVREDLGVCQSVQRNMEAGIYRAGLLSPRQEGHTARFQALVREAVGNVEVPPAV
ncbi:MAG: aromatic ring-hydroxylating dioxygenase subunit alpha [Alphaproteobacteria bacterium]